MTIPGAIGASLVDYSTGLVLSTAGDAPAADHDAAGISAASVVRAATGHAPFAAAQPGELVDDIIITSTGAYHLLRLVHTGFDSRLLLYLWLDRHIGNLAVARRRLQSLTDGLVLV